MAESTAGFWMSIYWGGLATGRLILGRVVDKFNVASVLRLCILSVILGAGLVWWSPANVLSFLGLALIGFAEGPIFPSLVSSTSGRVAAGHVDNAIGFEITAASLGVADRLSPVWPASWRRGDRWRSLDHSLLDVLS